MSPSRAALAALATLTACTLGAFGGAAQPTSTAPTIKFIITHPAGGLPDTVARIVGRRMQERLNQTIVVENRSGANGGIAVNAMTQRARPTAPPSWSPTARSCRSIRSSIPSFVQPEGRRPDRGARHRAAVPGAHPSLPVSTMTEFIAHVKANPGKYNIGSSGRRQHPSYFP